MIQYLCDRCHEKIADWLKTDILIERQADYLKKDYEAMIHLCPKCTDELIKWIAKD